MRNDGHEFDRYCAWLRNLNRKEFDGNLWEITPSSGLSNKEKMSKSWDNFFKRMEETEDE